MAPATQLAINPCIFPPAFRSPQSPPRISSVPPDGSELPNGDATVPGNGNLEDTSESQSGEALSEQALLERARQGDAGSFGELIRRHFKSCVQRATYILHNADDAEDEVQNACWKAFQRLQQFQGTGTFAAWLSRIVENQCLMRLRENRKASFVHLDGTPESNVRIELVGQMDNPEDDLGDREVGCLVRKEISRIPAIMRDVMVLADLEGLPLADVATSLGLTVPAAKSRLSRARAELRVRMSKHCGQRSHGTLTHKSRYGRLAFAHRD
jgi:RNA polymerase sigma-70 factor, ECF subfamily